MKVLVSFLGTSSYNREYRTAKYKFDDSSEEIESSFIASAIKRHTHIDKIILVGTTHSMWEEVYSHFARENGNFDEDYYCELGDFCDKANHNTALEMFPDIEKLQDGIGKNSEVILIKYGLNKDEIGYNEQQILQIESMLNSNDELYVDITHSFRSLPLFLLNTLIFIQNVSTKQIVIKDVYYGMLEVSKELGYTPIVNLNSVLSANDWIIGAYAFKEYANSYKLVECLGNDHKSASKDLKCFSNIGNLSYIAALKSQMTVVTRLRSENALPSMGKMVCEPILNDWKDKFSNVIYVSQKQYRLALWQYEHFNFSASFMALSEAIISYLCEISNKKVMSKEDRNEMKESVNKYPIINNTYKKIKTIRNQIAHAVDGGKDVDKMLKTLQDSLKEVKKLVEGPRFNSLHERTN